MTVIGMGIVIVIGIVMEGVMYPHEYACPDSEALCNRMVRIHRRAELPLTHSTTRQDKIRQDERGLDRG